MLINAQTWELPESWLPLTSRSAPSLSWAVIQDKRYYNLNIEKPANINLGLGLGIGLVNLF